jgi:hypothetical protein
VDPTADAQTGGDAHAGPAAQLDAWNHIPPIATPTAGGDPTMSDDEQDVFTLAKSYFDLREYRHAAHVLSRQQCAHPKSTFLRIYAMLMVE